MVGDGAAKVCDADSDSDGDVIYACMNSCVNKRLYGHIHMYMHMYDDECGDQVFLQWGAAVYIHTYIQHA